MISEIQQIQTDLRRVGYTAPTSYGQVFGTAASSGFKGGLGNKLWRGAVTAFKDWTDDEELDIDRLNEEYGEEGLTFDEPMSKAAAEYVRRKHLERQPEEYILAKAINESASNYIPLIAGSFLGNIADPGELALGIASGGLATTRYGAKIGLGIQSTVGRTAYRGAAFGMGEAIVSEPIHQGLSSYMNEKYTWQDSMMNVAFATGLGGAMGAGFGKFGKPEDLEIIAPATLEGIIVDNLEGMATFKKQNRMIEIFADDDGAIRDANADIINKHIEAKLQEAREQKGSKLTPEEETAIANQADIDAVFELKLKTQQDLSKREIPKEVAEEPEPDPTPFDNPESPEYLNAIKETYEGDIETPTTKATEADKAKAEQAEAEPEVDPLDVVYAAKSATESLFPSTKIEAILPDGSNLPKGFNPLKKAGYDRKTGKIYLNSAFISDAKDATATILHETIGHKGFEANFSSKEKMDEFLRYIGSAHKKDIKAIKSELGVDKKTATLELIARVAENKVQSPRLMETLIAEAKFKLGLDPSKTNSVDDVLIRDALTRGYFKMRKGDVAQSIVRDGIVYKEASKEDADKIKQIREKELAKVKGAVTQDAINKITGENGELPMGYKPIQEVEIEGKKYKLDVNALVDATINGAVFNRLLSRFSEITDDVGTRLRDMLENYVYKQSEELSSRYTGSFATKLRKANLEDFFESKENIKMLYRHLYGQKSTEEAKRVAEILQSVTYPAIRRQNRAGGKTRILKDHVVPRFYSKNKFAEAAGFTNRMGNVIETTEAKQKTRQLFIDWMMGRTTIKETKGRLQVAQGGNNRIRVDVARTFGDEIPSNQDMEKYFGDIFNSVWEGNELDSQGGSGSSSLSTKSGAERKIHFIDGDTGFEFDQLFGVSDTSSGIYDMLRKFARNTVLMENFGTNPKNMIQRNLIPALGRIANKGDMAMAAKSLKDFAKTVDASFSLIDPNFRSTDYPTASKLSWAARQLTNVSMLGGLLFTSSSDVANVAGRLNLFNIDGNYVNSFFNIFKPKDKASRLMLENNLAYYESLVSSLNRVDPQNPGTSNKIARLTHKFFDITGMNWWNRWMRETFIDGFHRSMGNNSKHSIDELRKIGGKGAFVADEIEAAGITKGEWDFIRKAARKIDENGNQLDPDDYYNTFLTSDMVQNISIEDAKGMLKTMGKKRTDLAAQKLIDELTSKYDGFVKRNMDAGVITPGIRQWRLMNMNQLEGSAASIIGKLIFQYKSFPLTMTQEIILPYMKYATKGNYKPMVSLMSTVAFGTSVQMVAMNTREVLSGRTAREWDDPQFWFEAFVKAGGAGIVADLLKDYSEYNTDIMSILGGPTVDLASDILGVGVQGIKSATMEDETLDDFVSNLAKTTKRMTPLGNMPGLIIIRDGLYNMTMQQFSPDSLDRANQFYQDRGQDMILQDNVTFKDIIGLE